MRGLGFFALAAALAALATPVNAVFELECAFVRTSGAVGVTPVGDLTLRYLPGTAVLEVAIDVVGLAADTTYGIHVHEFGDLSDSSGASLGGHWNPTNASHGCPPNWPRHYGDLGNFTSDGVGRIDFPSVTFGGWPENPMDGTNSMVGRGVIIHENPDTCTGSAGNAGARIAMCVLGSSVANTEANSADDWSNGAIAMMSGTVNALGTSGRVDFEPIFTQTGPALRVAAQFTGLSGLHGFHVHEHGDLTDATGLSLGGHFNPFGSEHSLPDSGDSRHVGDMGNIYHYESTTAWYHYINHVLALSGTASVLGRGVLVHAVEDVCTQPTGSSGARYTYGVIGHRNPSSAYMTVPASVPTTQDPARCLTYEATAEIAGTANDPGVYGTVTFSVDPVTFDMTVNASIHNITVNPDADHALHIHWYGDLSNMITGSSAGGHWNPTGANHSCPDTPDRHWGDMGNWTAVGGSITQAVTLTGVFTSNPLTRAGWGSTTSAIGRAVVLHAVNDSCAGAAGDAGSRLALGVIGVANVPGNAAEGDDLVSGAGFIAALQGTSNLPGASGIVDFLDAGAGATRVAARVDGLTGTHGFHVHWYGDISAASGTSTGGHFNPSDAIHSLPPRTARHVGDMGNIYHYESTTAWYDYTNAVIPSANWSAHNVVGRGTIVHALEDTCVQPTGGAGARMLMAVIGHRNPGTAALVVPGTVPTTQNSSACAYQDVLYEAQCEFVGTSNDPAISGGATLRVNAVSFDVEVTLDIQGITMNPDALHPVHIHQYGDLSLATGTSAGGHWNPAGANHSCPGLPGPRHYGDLGNYPTVGGAIQGTWTVTGMPENILDGTNSALGRALVIHAEPDQCTGATGFAGARLGVCVLGLANTPDNMANTRDTAPDGAVVSLRGTSNLPSGSGMVEMMQAGASGVRTRATFDGLAQDSLHGFHIHTYGDLSSADGTSAAGHFNPVGTTHALPGTLPRHVGDLGNIYSYNGTATASYDYTTDFMTVGGTLENNIIGRANIVHANEDVCVQPTGAAGSRYLIGVVGHRNPSTAALSIPASTPTTQNNTACPVYEAVCEFMGTTADPGIRGTARLMASENTLYVWANITGITVNPTAEHGLHIHWYGDLSNDTGVSAGGHWNPTNDAHACPDTWPRQFGDMGSWTSESGAITMYKTLTGYPVNVLASNMSAIGRALVLHAEPDLCNGTSGFAGARLATCVIGVANVPNNMARSEDVSPNGAIAVLAGTSNLPASSGRVDYTPGATAVNTTATVSGLTAGSVHGFHVHWYGDLSNADGTSAGGHFNPFGVNHSLPDNTPRHVGDLGNIYHYEGAEAWYQYTNDLIHVSGDDMGNIIGRANIVHALEDVCVQPTGAAGSRYLIGVIGHRNPGTDSLIAPPGVPSFQNASRCVTPGSNTPSSPPPPPSSTTTGVIAVSAAPVSTNVMVAVLLFALAVAFTA